VGANKNSIGIAGDELYYASPITIRPLNRFDIDPGVAEKRAEPGQGAGPVLEDHGELGGHMRGDIT